MTVIVPYRQSALPSYRYRYTVSVTAVSADAQFTLQHFESHPHSLNESPVHAAALCVASGSVRKMPPPDSKKEIHGTGVFPYKFNKLTN